jgi:hypothetical protein
MLGDIIAQQVGHHPGAGFDVLRVARLGLYGLCLDGPLGSAWWVARSCLHSLACCAHTTSPRWCIVSAAFPCLLHASCTTSGIATAAALEPG